MTSSEKLRAEFHVLIDNYKDSDLLEKHFKSLKYEQEMDEEPEPNAYNLSEKQLEDIDISFEEIKQGKTRSNEEVMKWMKQYRSK
jgi:hypothetical protein